MSGWLADFQRDFGDAIRTPLDRTSGTLRAQPERYAESLGARLSPGPTLSALERLAVYNRQYWFRLFGVLQAEHPLTARLCGYWRFNDHAARFLSASPPRGADIRHAADGFVDHLRRELATEGTPHAIVEAAVIDRAFAALWHAPAAEPAMRLSAEDEARLARGRLRPRPTWTMVEEHWPLFALRRALADRKEEGAAALPAPHPRAVSYVVVHGGQSVFELELSDRQACLFRALRERPVAEALGELEARSSAEERRRLASDVRGWLAQSVELGFWGGFDG